jgi:acyl-CoA thioester hydrolase
MTSLPPTATLPDFDADVNAMIHAAAPAHHGTWTGATALDPAIPVHCYFDWVHTARADEEDENGHVSNVSYVRWIQDAARAHSEFLGLDRAAYEGLGGTFIVKRHEVDYRLGCHAAEQVVVTTSVEEIRIASAIRRTRVIRVSDGREVLLARTEWVYVSIEGHRPMRIPPIVMERFELVGKLNRGKRERSQPADDATHPSTPPEVA